jgi:hypothetical protein
MWRRALAGLAAAALSLLPVSSRSEDLAREEAVFEAVFRQQLSEHLDVAARARGTVMCVAIDPGGAPQSPTQAVMKRLSEDLAVRRMAECDRRPTGAVESRSLRPAIIVIAGPIDWIADDEAHVAVAYFRTARESALRKYRVVKERSGWVSLGPILLDGPA